MAAPFHTIIKLRQMHHHPRKLESSSTAATIMTLKNKAHSIAVNHPINNVTLDTHPRTAKLGIDAARRKPLRELFKTCFDHSAESSASDATTVEKCVRFENKSSSGKTTLSIRDYTSDEFRATWYVREDYQRISRQCQKEIRKLNNGSKLKDKKYCSRGLEGCTNAGSVLKERNRMFSFNAVLNEQLVQWDEGVFDEDAIAAIYIRTSSSWCQMLANVVGQQDQKANEEFLLVRPLSSSSSTTTGRSSSTTAGLPRLERSSVVSAAS